MNQNITVLFSPTRSMAYNYSLYPFWTSIHRQEFRFTQNVDWVLEKDKNPTLIMVGWLKKSKGSWTNEFFEKLRDKYKVMVYFDDNDGAECHYFNLFKFFDLVYKKQIFKEKKNYIRQLKFYGNRIFSNFYHEKMGILEEDVETGLVKPFSQVNNVRDLEKLRVSWNLALGHHYPLSSLKSSVCRRLFKYRLFNLVGSWGVSMFQPKFPKNWKPPSPRTKLCHARFGFEKYRYSVGYQRRLFLEKVKDNPLFLSGRVHRKQYQREIKNTQVVLSPFGWGEICFRDFEAILNGCVLVKPNMEHVETWPNIYKDDETYVSVKWDGSDLIEKVCQLLKDKEKIEYLRNNAWLELKKAYEKKEERIERLLEEIQVFL